MTIDENDVDEQQIAALLAHPTITAAAAAVGVDPKTLSRRLREPAFAAALVTARRAVLSMTSTQLVSACTDAVATLRTVSLDTAAPHAARVSASRALLEAALRASELEDLSARLVAIENAIRERGAA